MSSTTNTHYPRKDWPPFEQLAYRRISTAEGKMLVVALDHPMDWMVDEPISNELWRDIKFDIVRHLGNYGPSILLDVGVALPGVITEGVLSPDTDLVIGMDDPSFEVDETTGLRESRVMPGYTAAFAKECGATAVKMLVWYRPDHEGSDGFAPELMRSLLDECNANGLPFILEIMIYPLENETPEEYDAIKGDLIVQAAEFGRSIGAHILKLQYPGSREKCQAVTDAAGDVPWALLSAAVSHEDFLVQMENALVAGAEGAMVGRSLWRDCIPADPSERRRLLSEVARPRLDELTSLLDRVR